MKNIKTKQIFLTGILAFSSSIMAADSTVTTSANQTNIQNEANNNKVLYNNASATSGTAQKDTYLKVLNNKNGTASQEQNLTDEQKQLSENFVHQGLANRVYQEKCSGEENSAICEGRDPKASKKILIQAISKAYAMFSGIAGDKVMGLTKPAKAPTGGTTGTGQQTPPAQGGQGTQGAQGAQGGADSAQKTESQTDYCQYIPMGTEMVSTTMQAMNAAALKVDTPQGETAQKTALAKAARSHEEKAKGSNIQAAGWGATAACYVGMAFTNTTLPSQGAWWVKMGAAAFLTTFYLGDAKDNKEYARKTREIENTLPGKGDCNPITEKDCYCSQPETENNAEYCLPQIHKKQIAANSSRVSCVDQNMKADPGCNCDKNGTCFEKLISNVDVNNELGFGTAGSQFSPIKKLTSGEAMTGVINGSIASQYNAIAKKKLAESKLAGPKVNLTAAERDLAKIYQDSGIPGNIAAHMATAQIPQSAINQAMNKMAGMSGSALDNIASLESARSANHIVDFSGGNGLLNNKAKGKSGDDLKSIFGNIGKKPEANNNNNKVIEFAVQKAQAANQITKSESSIFQIISNRYMNSAPRLLELEQQK